jgi:CubicO group peptidase (beta-lactamase class C family)
MLDDGSQPGGVKVSGPRSDSACEISGPWSAQIDALFPVCSTPGHPGLTLGVIEGGRVVHARAYGLACVEDDAPLSLASVLHLGSTTKHFCAACILILEDRGLLGLEQSVRTHLPALPDFAQAITLRHLLTMTSGLPDGLNYPYFAGLPPGTLDQESHLAIVRRLTAPMFAPGAGATYSNTNYLLLSRVVERVSGVSLGEFMGRELFAPLGMASTQLVSDSALALPRKARGYTMDGEGRFVAHTPMQHLCGDGGVVTTLQDLMKWALNYADDRLIARDFRARLEEEARLDDGSATGYGLGMGLSSAGGMRKVSHGGGMPGYLADLAYFPDKDLAVVWLGNWMEPALFEATDKVAAIVAGKDHALPTPPAADAAFARLHGLYANFSLGCTAQFEAADGGAVMHIMGERLNLERTGPAEYRPTKTSAYYPMRITDRSLGCRPVVEIRIGEVRWSEFLPIVEAEGAIEASDYVGVYHCDLLGETHRIALTDGGLEISLESAVRRLLWRTLKPRGSELFSAVIPGEPNDTDVSLIFRRDVRGRVAGFDYNLSRTRGVAFRRLDDQP